jgi:hypothetical protein
MFKTNENMTDRIVRIVVGVALIAAYFLFPTLLGSWNWLLWIGVIPLVTGAVGWCALYQLFGISTKKAE